MTEFAWSIRPSWHLLPKERRAVKAPVSDPTLLRQRLLALQMRRKERGALEGPELEALAECSFRLAVNPATPFEQALSLLQQAFRLDGANPKLVYHLGRLYFQHGMLAEARDWIALACRLCPTSHRIWTHICLLQWELNEQFYGDAQFTPDALLERGNTVANRVREGIDTFEPELMCFVPPMSKAALEKKHRAGSAPDPTSPDDTSPGSRQPRSGGARGGSADGRGTRSEHADGAQPARQVRRFHDAGICRWTGISDLMVEQLLLAKPSQQGVERVAPLLAQLAELSRRRRGGAAGFAILAVEWLVSGYPVTTVRRLLETVDPTSSPARALVELVCEIYESDEADVPWMLADALRAGTLPPLLVAVIHRRRVIWRPLEYRGLSTLRQGRRLLAENYRRPASTPERIKELASDAALLAGKLRNNLKQFLEPSPPSPLRDWEPKPEEAESVAVESVAVQFARVEAGAAALEQLRDAALGLLRSQVVGPSQQNGAEAQVWQQCASDLAALRKLVEAIEQSGQQGITLLESIAAAAARSGQAQMPDDFIARKEACDRKLKAAMSLGNFQRQLKQVEKRLSAAAIVTDGRAPSASLLELTDKVRAAFAAPHSGPPTPDESLAALAHAAVALTEARTAALAFLLQRLEPAARQATEPGAQSQAKADHTALGEIRQALQHAGENGSGRIGQMLERVGQLDSAQLPPKFAEQCEACKKQFLELSNLGNFSRALARVNKLLSSCDAASPVLPSAELATLQATIFDAFGTLEPADDAAADLAPKLAALEHRVEHLASVVDGVASRAAGLASLVASGKSQVAAQAAPAADRLRRELQKSLRTGAPLVHEIGELQRVGVPGEALRAAIAALQQRCQAVAERAATLKLPLESLPTHAEPRAMPPTAGNAAKTAASPELTGLAALEQAVNDTWAGIVAAFEHAEATFADYPPWALRLPPLQAVRATVRGRRAELCYRLGQRVQARAFWNTLLREDRLDADTAHNIAVCDTSSPDVVQQLGSWQAYMELLYFYDIVRDDVRPYAAARAEFHRAFGDSFAPVILQQKLDESWKEKLDKDAAFAFVQNAARVKSFVDHKLHEFVNYQIDYRSPRLILGTSLQDGPEKCDDAHKTMVALVQATCGCLPEHIGQPFTGLVVQHLETALAACSTKNRQQAQAAEANYTQEKDERHFKLLIATANLKLKLYSMLNSIPRLGARLRSVDFLPELCRLDALPLNQSEEFATAVAGSLGMTPDELMKLMHMAAQNVLVDWLKYLFSEVRDPEERNIRQQAYGRMVEMLKSQSTLAEQAKLTNHGRSFYPDSAVQMIEAFSEHGASAQLITLMRQWHESYPHLTGVTLDLAHLLWGEGNHDEAIQVLERSSQDGIHPTGRADCRRFWLQLKCHRHVQSEDFAGAVEYSRELLDGDDENTSFPHDFMQLYSNLTAKKGSDPGSAEMQKAVQDWLARARARLGDWKPTNEQSRPPITADQLRRIETELERTLVMIRYHLMVAEFNRGISAANANQPRSTVEAHFTAVELQAHALTGDPWLDEDCRSGMQTILDRVRDYRARN
jgi:hypothetical protein